MILNKKRKGIGVCHYLSPTAIYFSCNDMIEATAQDKHLIIEILTSSFNNNRSVNYLIPQDTKRMDRIRALMDYSYEMCKASGKILLSDDRKACALVLFPEQKRTTLRSLLLTLRLIVKSIGLQNILKAMNREGRIAEHHPKTPFYHLWFIGVEPEFQGEGVGGKLLNEILEDAKRMKRPVYLETSTLKNLPWYEKNGLTIFGKLELTYTLYLLRCT